MEINGKNYDVDNLVKELNIEKDFIKRRENGLLLSDYQIEVLKRNEINYDKCKSIKELIFDIEEIIDDIDDEELEKVLFDLSEVDYYNYTNK